MVETWGSLGTTERLPQGPIAKRGPLQAFVRTMVIQETYAP